MKITSSFGFLGSGRRNKKNIQMRWPSREVLDSGFAGVDSEFVYLSNRMYFVLANYANATDYLSLVIRFYSKPQVP